MGSIEDFQKDLREGMSIEAALKKHNLTFKEAWELCPKPCYFHEKKRKSKKNDVRGVGKYIQKRGNTYYIRKHVNHTTKGFGAYNSLKDAETVRDYLVKNGWNEVKVREVCKKYGIKRRR